MSMLKGENIAEKALPWAELVEGEIYVVCYIAIYHPSINSGLV